MGVRKLIEHIGISKFSDKITRKINKIELILCDKNGGRTWRTLQELESKLYILVSLVKWMLVLLVPFGVIGIWLLSILYVHEEVIWNESSPKGDFSVNVKIASFFILSTVTVHAKKENEDRENTLITEHLTQDLCSVYERDISSNWESDTKCILYIEGEIEYIQATIELDVQGNIQCSYVKESLFLINIKWETSLL